MAGTKKSLVVAPLARVESVSQLPFNSRPVPALTSYLMTPQESGTTYLYISSNFALDRALICGAKRSVKSKITTYVKIGRPALLRSHEIGCKRSLRDRYEALPRPFRMVLAGLTERDISTWGRSRAISFVQECSYGPFLRIRKPEGISLF